MVYLFILSFISFDDVLCLSLRGFSYIFISVSNIIYPLLNYLYFRVSLCTSLGAWILYVVYLCIYAFIERIIEQEIYFEVRLVTETSATV